MPMTSKDMEKLILADGWIREKGKATGHRQYTHPSKSGKVTIPFSSRKKILSKKTENSILKQTGLK